MTEIELQKHIQEHFPKENESCEWKAYSNLTHDVSGSKGDDVISYVSAIANMQGGRNDGNDAKSKWVLINT